MTRQYAETAASVRAARGRCAAAMSQSVSPGATTYPAGARPAPPSWADCRPPPAPPAAPATPTATVRGAGSTGPAPPAAPATPAATAGEPVPGRGSPAPVRVGVVTAGEPVPGRDRRGSAQAVVAAPAVAAGT